METKSNQILVGSVMLALVVALVVFLVWLGQLSEGSRQGYDIFFQSVEGLDKGSAVTYNGVPVGQVERIELDPRNPQFVRVRITVKSETPVLAPTQMPNGEQLNDGTTATISGVGFTGVSQVQLSLPNSQRPAGERQHLTCPAENTAARCPYGVPVIPPRPGGFAAILNSAPELLDRVTRLTERLTALFSEDNQRSIASILRNLDRTSASLAERGPEIAATLAEARTTLRQAGDAMDRIGQLAQSTDRMLNSDGQSTMAELRRTLQAASGSLESLQQAVNAARPGVETFSTRTLPEVGALIRDLRSTSQSLRNVSQRLEQRGVRGLLGSERLPDYEPGGRRRGGSEPREPAAAPPPQQNSSEPRQ